MAVARRPIPVVSPREEVRVGREATGRPFRAAGWPSGDRETDDLVVRAVEALRLGATPCRSGGDLPPNREDSSSPSRTGALCPSSSPTLGLAFLLYPTPILASSPVATLGWPSGGRRRPGLMGSRRRRGGSLSHSLRGRVLGAVPVGWDRAYVACSGSRPASLVRRAGRAASNVSGPLRAGPLLPARSPAEWQRKAEEVAS